MRVVRSQLNRVYRTALLALVVALIAGLFPLQTVNAASMEVDIPYVQTWKNDSDRTGVDNTFKYRLTAADNASPLPDEALGGAYDFELKGNTSGDLKLHFGYYRPGYYNYTVSQVIGSKKDGYTYDEDTFNVMVMVLNGSDGLTVGAITIQDEELAKYAALPFANFYYHARRSTPSRGSGGGGTAAVQTAAAETGDEAEPEDSKAEPEDIEDTRPPLVEKADEDYWALLNLILMILTVVVSAADIGLYFRKDDDDEDDELGEDEEDREDRRRRRHIRLRTGTLLPAIGGLILFLLTEDIRLPMEFVDEWTIWMVVIFAVCAVLALLSRERTDEDDDDEE